MGHPQHSHYKLAKLVRIPGSVSPRREYAATFADLR